MNPISSPALHVGSSFATPVSHNSLASTTSCHVPNCALLVICPLSAQHGILHSLVVLSCILSASTSRHACSPSIPPAFRFVHPHEIYRCTHIYTAISKKSPRRTSEYNSLQSTIHYPRVVVYEKKVSFTHHRDNIHISAESVIVSPWLTTYRITRLIHHHSLEQIGTIVGEEGFSLWPDTTGWVNRRHGGYVFCCLTLSVESNF